MRKGNFIHGRTVNCAFAQSPQSLRCSLTQYREQEEFSDTEPHRLAFLSGCVRLKDHLLHSVMRSNVQKQWHQVHRPTMVDPEGDSEGLIEFLWPLIWKSNSTLKLFSTSIFILILFYSQSPVLWFKPKFNNMNDRMWLLLQVSDFLPPISGSQGAIFGSLWLPTFTVAMRFSKLIQQPNGEIYGLRERWMSWI